MVYLLQPFYTFLYFSHKKQRNRSAVTNLRKMKTHKYFEQYEAKHDAIWFILWFDLLSNFSRRNGAVLINIYNHFLKFYFFWWLKRWRRVLEGSSPDPSPWLLSLIPLNKKISIRFPRNFLWFFATLKKWLIINN